jgi:hypothetical protein
MGKRDGADPTRMENLHLFVSSITCNITCGEFLKLDSAPSTYVSFVSTPRDAMKKDVSMKEKLRNFLGISTSTKITENKTQVQMGWPRTKCAERTCNPHWKDEVHFKVRTHDNAGSPIDLTGALLHVLLFDAKDNSQLIGSSSLNLGFLISMSRAERGKRALQRTQSARPSRRISSTMTAPVASHDDRSCPHTAENSELLQNKPEQQALTTSWSSEEDTIIEKFASSGPSSALRCAFCSSIFASNTRKITQNALKKTMDSSPGSTALDSLDIHSLTIDEPLTKNGREVGRIQFTIDAWWLASDKATSTEVPLRTREAHESIRY